MALYTGRTSKYTRSARFDAATLAAIQDAKQGVYVNDKPYLFECGQEVIVTKRTSPYYSMTGVIVNRFSGSPAKYKVRIGFIGAQFLETELTALRFLPVPLWVVSGHRDKVDRIMIYGHEFRADSAIAARLMKRQAEERRRNAPQPTICLPKWTQTTARAAVAPLVKARVRRDYIKHIEARLWERKSFSTLENAA